MLKTLNKKYKYRLGICGYCEKPLLVREQTKRELRLYTKKFEGKSVSKFKQRELIPIKRFCNCELEMIISVPYSYSKAMRMFKEMDLLKI
jgi:hypothetical protein